MRMRICSGPFVSPSILQVCTHAWQCQVSKRGEYSYHGDVPILEESTLMWSGTVDVAQVFHAAVDC
jgi:hypothetical protein